MKVRIATKLAELRAACLSLPAGRQGGRQARASDVPSPEPRYDNIFFAAVEAMNKNDFHDERCPGVVAEMEFCQECDRDELL